MANIVDSYSESNQDASNVYSSSSGANNMLGQSFTGDGSILDSAKVYLKRNGSATGSIKIYIYAHTGTYGTDGTPTGSVLATSETIDVSTLSTSFALQTFNFSGADRISLGNGTKYFVVAEFSVTSASPNNVSIGTDSSSPSHAGNLAYFQTGAWTADNTRDMIFYVYGVPNSPSASLSPSASPSSSPSSSASASPSPSPLPPHATVLVVSKTGIDAIKNSDPEKNIFDSRYGTLKYYTKQQVNISFDASTGDISAQGSYNHNLGYYPYVEVFVRVYIGSPSGNYEYCPFAGAGATVLYDATYKITTTQIVVYGEINGVSSSVWNFDFLIFVYKNDLQLS